MSKASEWAAQAEVLQAEIARLEEEIGELDIRIAYEQDGKPGSVHATVLDAEHMFLSAYDATLARTGALILARWILDTFGDGA